MADAHGALTDLTSTIENLPDVSKTFIQEYGDHSFKLLVELAQFNPDTWGRIVQVVDDIGRDQINVASIDLDILVLSTAG